MHLAKSSDKDYQRSVRKTRNKRSKVSVVEIGKSSDTRENRGTNHGDSGTNNGANNGNVVSPVVVVTNNTSRNANNASNSRYKTLGTNTLWSRGSWGNTNDNRTAGHASDALMSLVNSNKVRRGKRPFRYFKTPAGA